MSAVPLHLLRLGLLVAIAAAPSSVSASTIELTPEGGEICCDPSDYSIRGYRFTVAEPFTAYGVEWWIQLPAGASIAARVYGPGDNLLLAGEPTVGDGAESWYRAEFNYTFELGQTYDVLVYLDAPNEAVFRRSDGLCCDYAVPPYLTAVESRSSTGEIDEPSTTYNVWPAYMRLVLDEPDADGDGVADGDDACPGSPAGDPVDATGCPATPDTTTTAGTTTAADASTGDTPTGTGGGPNSTGIEATADSADSAGSAASSNATTPITTQADAADHGDDGCGCTTRSSRAPWLLPAVVALVLRRKRPRGRPRVDQTLAGPSVLSACSSRRPAGLERPRCRP